MKRSASMELEHRTRGEESRARLLAVAAQEFAQHGYHETKISTIVALAGVSQPTFYFYFPGKEAIFAELVASFRSQFRALLENEPVPTGLTLSHVTVQLQAKMEAVFRLFVADINLTRLCLEQASDAEQIKQEIAAMLHIRLLMLQKAGYIRPDISIDMIAEYLNGAMERLTARYLLTGKSDPATLAWQAVEIGFKGILSQQVLLTGLDELKLDIVPEA